MVQISEDVLKRAKDLLFLTELRERNMAAQTRNHRKCNKHWNMAQEIRAVLDDIAAALDPKE